MQKNKPFIFLHAPRTAGTTLNRILAANFAPDALLSIYTEEEYERLRHLNAHDLAGVRLIQGHVFLDQYTPPLFRGCEVRPFTFLRDPVTRLVSEYVFLKTWPRNHLYSLLNEKKISFREYLTSNDKRLKYRGKNFLVRFITGEDVPHEGDCSEVLAKAKDNLENVFEFVGIVERFDASLLLLGEWLGVKELLYEKRNALRNKGDTAISESDLALARELNAADVALYAFACSLFERRVQEKGEAFSASVRRFRMINERYQKVCSLIDTRVPELEKGDILLSKDI